MEEGGREEKVVAGGGRNRNCCVPALWRWLALPEARKGVVGGGVGGVGVEAGEWWWSGARVMTMRSSQGRAVWWGSSSQLVTPATHRLSHE